MRATAPVITPTPTRCAGLGLVTRSIAACPPARRALTIVNSGYQSSLRQREGALPASQGTGKQVTGSGDYPASPELCRLTIVLWGNFADHVGLADGLAGLA